MTWLGFLADFSICVPAQQGGCAACVLPEFGKIFVVPLGHDYVLHEALSRPSWVAYSGIADDRAGAEINLVTRALYQWFDLEQLPGCTASIFRGFIL
jgi:hypothetical protein